MMMMMMMMIYHQEEEEEEKLEEGRGAIGVSDIVKCGWMRRHWADGEDCVIVSGVEGG